MKISSTVTKAKVDFIRSLVKANPEVKIEDIQNQLKERFQTKMNRRKLYQVRNEAQKEFYQEVAHAEQEAESQGAQQQTA